MPSPSDRDSIKITAEDLLKVDSGSGGACSNRSRVWCESVWHDPETAEQFVSVPAERGSILLLGWFTLVWRDC